MVLSDRTIKEEIAKGRIVIDPLDPSCIQPASLDVHLDKKILAFKPQRHTAYIDIRRSMDHLNELVELDEDNAFFLNPGEFILASTLESVTLPDDIVGRLEGKSSLGRIGLLVNSTAGYVDPGWQGHLTMEVSNVAKLPITLYYKMKIGQISFLRLTTPVDKLYGAAELGSKYKGQVEPTATKFYEDIVRGS
jgi:dCTP deaminase